MNFLRQRLAELRYQRAVQSLARAVQAELAIRSIARALSGLAQVDAEPAFAQAPVKATAAQVRKSITPEALISFEDGKPYRLLKRHLATVGLTPETYRGKWGLPADYPMVAPSYSAARSKMAKSFGLGRAVRGKA